MGHNQVYTKVNVPVDEGMRELIDALSLFTRLETIESCQGYKTRDAWVCFNYGDYWNHPWKELAEFVLGQLGPKLAHEVGDNADVSIHVSENGQIRGEIFIRHGALSRVSDVILKLHQEINLSRPSI